MKYRNLLAVAMLCAGFLSSSTFCSPEPSRQYLQMFLENSCYAPHVIKYLREKHIQSVSEINDILENHYMSEYRRAIANETTRMEKLMKLGMMQDHLVLSPGAIARGQEGPALMKTDDGSDRGGLGLRMQAIKKVISEVEDMQQ